MYEMFLPPVVDCSLIMLCGVDRRCERRHRVGSIRRRMRRVLSYCWVSFYTFHPFRAATLFSSFPPHTHINPTSFYTVCAVCHLIAWSDALYAYMSLPVRYTTSYIMHLRALGRAWTAALAAAVLPLLCCETDEDFKKLRKR
jgi:hypothetical protein